MTFDRGFCKRMKCPEFYVFEVPKDSNGEQGECCRVVCDFDDHDCKEDDCRICMEKHWRPESCSYRLELLMLEKP